MKVAIDIIRLEKSKINPFLNILPAILFLVQYTTGQENNNFPPPENPLEIQATKVAGTITIDGKLNEMDREKPP